MSNEKVVIPVLITLMPILFFIFSVIYVFSHLKIKLTEVATSLLGIIYIPLMMLFLILTWHRPNGFLWVWFIFGGAWVTDTFAYLIGKAMGKHKFSKISPNKSVEGCIAGLLGSALFYGLYTYYLNTHFLAEIGGKEYNIALMTVIGTVISVISQIGDFTASAIKRQCEIKDFGKIMPGHGGILDRFDSILMIAPFVYILLEWMV